MIEINLIPAHLRKKSVRDSDVLTFLNLPKEFVLGCASLFIFIIVLIHAVLLSIWLVKSAKYAVVRSQWQQMAPQKSTIDSISAEQKDLNAKIKLINDVASKKMIVWSQKLNIISDAIPKGLWIRKINFNNGVLTIEGNAYSKAHDEITLVGNFVASLKKDGKFMKDFSSMELNSVTRIKKGPTEVADFLITAKTKEQVEADAKKAQAK